MRSRQVWSWFVAALVVTFVEVARAQSPAEPTDTPQPAAPSSDAAPRPSLVPTLGKRTPEHLQAGEQYYDLSVRGLRLRLESLKHTDAANYARLDDELSRLETRRTASYILLGTSVVAPLATLGIYTAVRSQQSCPSMPSVMTPNFEQASAAWHACHRAQSEFDATPFAIGGALMVAGLVGAWIVAPKRSELLEFVNLHNRLTVQPIRWQLGYDPTRRSAFAGASFHF